MKRYSSGMYVRLAFAVAAHLEPEILIVDEVLAVGDAEFQKKCLGKMGQSRAKGRQFCSSATTWARCRSSALESFLLNGGQISSDGEVNQVIRRYLDRPDSADATFSRAGRRVSPNRVMVKDAWLENDGVRVASLLFGDVPILKMLIEAKETTTFSVELILRQADGVPVAFIPSGLAQDWHVDANWGTAVILAELPPTRMAAGVYYIDIMLADEESLFLTELNWRFHSVWKAPRLAPRIGCLPKDRDRGTNFGTSGLK